MDLHYRPKRIIQDFDAKLFLSDPDLTMGLACLYGVIPCFERPNIINGSFLTPYIWIFSSLLTSWGAAIVHDCLPDDFKWLPSMAIIISGAYRINACINNVRLVPRIEYVCNRNPGV